ncbi:hypothetical protein A2U01_0047335, partial [Trifolium medium]|nr:hypothetical protein [Trifolium medium]
MEGQSQEEHEFVREESSYEESRNATFDNDEDNIYDDETTETTDDGINNESDEDLEVGIDGNNSPAGAVESIPIDCVADIMKIDMKNISV